MLTPLNLKLSLPEDLVQEAKVAGLLKSEAIEQLLRNEVRKQRVDKLFESADRLADLELPILTIDQVAAEIQAARAEKRVE
ncbi:MAG: type II toxin-antitoxin system CcdA family antitoxin [Chloroflexota bacterium]|nr:type II toxin-antitoxin system CcdA family antitoxin [Chloroflexota bacterium]